MFAYDNDLELQILVKFSTSLFRSYFPRRTTHVLPHFGSRELSVSFIGISGFSSGLADDSFVWSRTIFVVSSLRWRRYGSCSRNLHKSVRSSVSRTGCRLVTRSRCESGAQRHRGWVPRRMDYPGLGVFVVHPFRLLKHCCCNVWSSPRLQFPVLVRIVRVRYKSL